MQRTASRFCSRQKRPGYTEILRKMGMGRFLQTAVSVVLFALLMLVPVATANQERQKPGKKEKSVRKDVMNFDGGVFFETDGSLSESRAFAFPGAPPRRTFSTDSNVSMTSMERITSADGRL